MVSNKQRGIISTIGYRYDMCAGKKYKFCGDNKIFWQAIFKEMYN